MHRINSAVLNVDDMLTSILEGAACNATMAELGNVQIRVSNVRREAIGGPGSSREMAGGNLNVLNDVRLM